MLRIITEKKTKQCSFCAPDWQEKTVQGKILVLRVFTERHEKMENCWRTFGSYLVAITRTAMRPGWLCLLIDRNSQSADELPGLTTSRFPLHATVGGGIKINESKNTSSTARNTDVWRDRICIPWNPPHPANASPVTQQTFRHANSRSMFTPFVVSSVSDVGCL